MSGDLRNPPVSATAAFGAMLWTAPSMRSVRAWASARLTALEMSPWCRKPTGRGACDS